MSRLNERKTPRIPVEEHKPQRPVKPRPPEQRRTLDKAQGRYERGLAKKHAAERDQTHKDIKRQQGKR